MPAGYSATIHCGPTREAPLPYAGGPFAVTSPLVDGATLTCTITNIQLFSTVRVVKHGSARPPRRRSSSTRTAPRRSTPRRSRPRAGTAPRSVYPVGTPATVGEVDVPAGYSASIHCGATLELPQPYSGGPFPVTSPTEAEPRSPARSSTGSCARPCESSRNGPERPRRRRSSSTRTGWRPTTPPRSRPRAASVPPLRTRSRPRSLSARPQCRPDSRATIDCGAGPQAYTGGPFPVTSPADPRSHADVHDHQHASDDRAHHQEWAGDVPPRRRSSSTAGPGLRSTSPRSPRRTDESVSFDYPPSTQATIGELVVPSGYLAVINCGTGPRDLRRYAGGPFTVTTPATPGDVLSCVLTNVQRPGPLAVLVLDKASNRRVLSPNQRVNFRITVRNRGRGTARNVLTCDRMPGPRVVSAPGARRSGRSLCWTVKTMRPRTTRTFKVVARVGPSSRRRVIVNPADVIASNTLNCRARTLPSDCGSVATGCRCAPRRWRRSRAGRSRPVHGLTR